MSHDRLLRWALSGLFLISQSTACGGEPNTHNASADTADDDSSADNSTGTIGGKEQRTAADWRPPPPSGPCGEGPLSYASDAVERTQPSWAEGAKIPITGRPNLYGYKRQELIERVRQGKQHTTIYPVDVTVSWMPQRLMDSVFALDEQKNDPIAQFVAAINPLSFFKDLNEYEYWLGLSPYPECDAKGAHGVPFPDGVRPSYAMGSTRKMINGAPAVTYSCAGCHASRLFGRSFLGLQNRGSHANVGIEDARTAIGLLPADWVAFGFGSTPAEAKMISNLQEGLKYVGTRPPVVRGLDTSLAQVALSLAKRSKDPYALRTPATSRTPRAERLTKSPADSKPGNWWTLKYKNRWLLDGSVVAGNPIYTNLLWNEVGRGTDLHELEQWLDTNQQVVEDLTAAVFSVEPPRYTEFFPAESIDLASAKRGKGLFDKQCARCHGTYEKAWDHPNAAAFTVAERLTTVEVRYHENTPVIDVGTSPLRNRGMDSLEQLNDLAISKKMGVLIRPQKGYVPPPLVGIWARFPYFHNNSAPTLCAVLTRAEERPAKYYSGDTQDPKLHFDAACNGYPTGDAVPADWLKDPEALYDTSVEGLSNRGHDEGVFLDNGKEIFTPAQKRDIIAFLQTL